MVVLVTASALLCSEGCLTVISFLEPDKVSGSTTVVKQEEETHTWRITNFARYLSARIHMDSTVSSV